MSYSNSWLIQQIITGNSPKYNYFLSDRCIQNADWDTHCFNECFVAPFTIDGTTYNTLTHWIMAQKAALFYDYTTMEKIIQTKQAAHAKLLACYIKNFDEEVWLAHAYSIVVKGNLHKFKKHYHLQRKLLNTQQNVIVAVTAQDNIWGNGLAYFSKELSNPLKWKGSNLLGYALMDVRDILQAQQAMQFVPKQQQFMSALSIARS
ncbi:MAG: NADAR family protein [Chitinophagaceae bacterium]|jgi:hypothetical protein|nr:NADAR family protein [Chitinophagaceae bacterium]